MYAVYVRVCMSVLQLQTTRQSSLTSNILFVCVCVYVLLTAILFWPSNGCTQDFLDSVVTHHRLCNGRSVCAPLKGRMRVANGLFIDLDIVCVYVCMYVCMDGWMDFVT